MIDLIRLGDSTDHGGEVITASDTMCYSGRRVARKGDQVTCSLHPDVNPNVILEGDETITDHGVPVARHGHHATCGCSLISSIARATTVVAWPARSTWGRVRCIPMSIQVSFSKAT